AYEHAGIWKEINEKIPIKEVKLPLKEFIKNYINSQETELPKDISTKKQKKFRAIQLLLDHILLLWEAPHYKAKSSINESTWAHNIIDPICQFLNFNLLDLRISWDNVMSQATRERNDLDGPIKKPDILGKYFGINATYDWEMDLLLIQHNSLDDAYRHYTSKCKNLYEDFHLLNLFLLQASGTFLEFFIMDKKYQPLYRLRRLEQIELPYQKHSLSVESVINLVSVLITYHKLIRKNLMLIKSIDTKLEINDSSGYNIVLDQFKQISLIPTLNTPRSSIIEKKK
ncbi:19266_t:CDS:2, partial [Racocetra persica]